MSAQRDCIHGHLARSCELCAAQNDHATACEQIDRLRAELAALRAERDDAEARAELWEDETAYAQDLAIRQGKLLRGVVNALRGPPPEDVLWSVHDAAELAAAMRERAEIAEAERDALRAWGEEAPHKQYCPWHFWQDESKCTCGKRAALGER